MNDNILETKTRAAIIEDEIPAARLLQKMISEMRPEWDITLIPGNIEDACNWFSSHVHPDIIFLDIQLSDGNSFFFLEKARPDSMIIFTTAYDEYAVRAFSVNSVDYLLKPIHTERLEEAIRKFERFNRKGDIAEYNKALDLGNILRSLTGKEKKYRTRFLININNRFSTLSVEDIAYFYSDEKTTYATTKDGRKQILDTTLNKLEEETDPDRFFRINRKFLVAVDSVSRLEPYFNNKYIIFLKPEYDGHITVSREKISAFKLWLDY